MKAVSGQDFAERVAACASRLVDEPVPAMASLFDLAAVRLVRYAATVTRNQDDAEDAVQAALVRVAGQPSSFQSAHYPWHYLLRSVRNEALQIVRRKRRQIVVRGLVEFVAGRRRDPIELAELQSGVWQALRKLPPEQAEIIVLKIWEELTFAEIGRILDRSPHTVASRYQYAIRRLETSLARVHQEFNV